MYHSTTTIMGMSNSIMPPNAISDTHIIHISPAIINYHHNDMSSIEEKTADFYKRIHGLPARDFMPSDEENQTTDIHDCGVSYPLARVERSPTPEERDELYKHTMELIADEKITCELMCDKLSQMVHDYPEAENMRECIRKRRNENIDKFYQKMMMHKWYTYPTDFSGECTLC